MKLVCESLEELYGIDIEAPEYSAGEKAAITKGQDVLTKQQLAAMYLAAKDAMGRSEDTRGRGDTALTRNAIKINKEESTDFKKLSIPRLGDVLDLKPRTVSYTISKFRLLMQGNREGIHGNDLYEKIINAFDEFDKMEKEGRAGEVYALAAEAVNIPLVFTEAITAAAMFCAVVVGFADTILNWSPVAPDAFAVNTTVPIVKVWFAEGLPVKVKTEVA